MNPGEAPAWLPGADGLSSFELARRGRPAARWRAGGAGAARGQVGRHAARGARRERAAGSVAEETGEYAFAPGGAGIRVHRAGGERLRPHARGRRRARARRAARCTRSRSRGTAGRSPTSRARSPGGRATCTSSVVGEAGALCGREVGEFRWAARAPRLAWLEQYDPRVRAGILGAGGPGLAPRTFGTNVSEFDISADGAHVAMMQHTTRGGYSVDLARRAPRRAEGHAGGDRRAGRLRVRLLARRALALLPDALHAERRGVRPRARPGRRARRGRRSRSRSRRG